MKIYLSRSTTRSMMADYPIGDPTGGPAYGEKRDPISAAFSVYSMYSAGVAIAGEVGLTLMTGLAFAGGALSLIGNITGNKTLSQIGMVAGVVGGIGGYLEQTNFFGEGARPFTDIFKSSSVPLDETASVLPGAQVAVADGGQTAGAAANPMMLDSAQPSALKASMVDVNTGPNNIPQAGPPDVDLSDRTSPYRMRTGGGAAPVTLANNTATAAPASGLMEPVDYSLMSKGPGTGLRLPNATGVPAKPEFLASLKEGKFGDAAMAAGSGAMGMLKDNPTGAYVAAQAIGAGVDYLSGKTDAELDQLKASTGYANAKALEIQTALDREKARRANINASYANVDAGIKVKQPGLVAGAMQST